MHMRAQIDLTDRTCKLGNLPTSVHRPWPGRREATGRWLYCEPMSEATPTEAESLLSVLDRNRRTFAWKTAGLDEKGLRLTTAASTMTLGGLVKHVALVDRLAGRQARRPGVRSPLGCRGFRRRPLVERPVVR